MLTRITNFLFTHPIGRFILIGGVALLVAYAVRFYYIDRPRIAREDLRVSGMERLDAMAASLGEALEGDDGEAIRERLPERSAWYPAELPCGAELAYPVPREPLWDVLGLPADGATGFQYRFDQQGERFVLRARRDTDCDGFYLVYTLTGSTDWTSVVGNRTHVQNAEE